ncbi:hypothetical protein RB200_37180 [Streptomyces sp. PmtG]
MNTPPDRTIKVRQEARPAAEDVLVGEDPGHLQLRPVVPRLPDQAGQRRHKGDRRADPQRLAAKELARAHREDGHRDDQPEADDQILALQGKGRDQARPQQQPVLTGAHPADEQPVHRRPQEQVDRHRRQRVPADQDGGGEAVGGRREQLRPAAPAELAGDERGDEHARHREQRGQQPQREQRAPGHRVDGAGKERKEHRLVRVPPAQVLPGAQEVQLVALEPVPRADREQGEAGRARHRAHPAPRELRVLCVLCGFLSLLFFRRDGGCFPPFLILFLDSLNRSLTGLRPYSHQGLRSLSTTWLKHARR